MFGSNEDISVMKINTHGGQDAFVYFLQKNPYFFEFDKIIFPTGLSSISCLQWRQCVNIVGKEIPLSSCRRAGVR